MGMVVVRCPITGNEIPTGIETESVVLEALPKVEAAV
jgi:hypothetical protein